MAKLLLESGDALLLESGDNLLLEGLSTDRYFVGLVDSDWNDIGNWSDSSGGSGGASIPTVANDVYFDENSPDCNIDVNVTVKTIDIQLWFTDTINASTFDVDISTDFKVAGGTLNMGSGTWTISGDVDFSGTPTINKETSIISLSGAGSGTQTIDFNGESIERFVVNDSGATKQLGPVELNCDSITLISGTMDFASNNPDVNITDGITASGLSQLDMGAGAWVLGGSWNTTALATFNHGTGTIEMTGTNVVFGNGPRRVNKLIVTGTVQAVFNCTAFSLEVSGTLSIYTGSFSLLDGTLQVNAGGSIMGTQRLELSGTDISVMDGSITTSTLRFSEDCTIATGTYGSLTVQFFHSSASANETFTFNSGTTTFSGDVEFNNNRPSYTTTIANATNNPNLTFGGDVSITEDADVGGLVWTKGTGTITLSGAGSGTQSIALLGKSVESIVVDDSGATKQISTTDLTCDDMTITAGEFDLNGYDLTVPGQFEISTNGTLRLEGDEVASGIDINSGTVIYDGTGTYPNLILGNTYHNLTFNSAGEFTLDDSQTINGSFIVNNITLNGNGKTVDVVGNMDMNNGDHDLSGATLNVGGNAIMNAVNLEAPSEWFLNVGGVGSADNVIVKNSNASGGNQINANTSVDNGGNDNWFFGAEPPDNVGVWNTLGRRPLPQLFLYKGGLP